MGVNIESLDTPPTPEEQAWLDSLSEEEKEIPVIEASDDEVSTVAEDIAGNVFLEAEDEHIEGEDDDTATEKTEEQLAAEAEAAKTVEDAPGDDSKLQNLEALSDELILVNAALEDAAAKVDEASDDLTAKMTKLEELAEALDDGLIGDGKYNLEKVKLEAEIAKLTAAVDKAAAIKAENEVKAADLSKQVEAAEQQQEQVIAKLQKEWVDDTANFLALPENAIFAKDPEAEKTIAEMVGVIHKRAVAKGITLSNNEVLAQARAAAKVLYPAIPDSSNKPIVKKEGVQVKPKHKPEPPITLGGVEKAVDNDTSGKDPLERIDRAPRDTRNKAYRNMSKQERDAYLGLA